MNDSLERYKKPTEPVAFDALDPDNVSPLIVRPFLKSTPRSRSSSAAFQLRLFAASNTADSPSLFVALMSAPLSRMTTDRAP